MDVAFDGQDCVCGSDREFKVLSSREVEFDENFLPTGIVRNVCRYRICLTCILDQIGGVT